MDCLNLAHGLHAHSVLATKTVQTQYFLRSATDARDRKSVMRMAHSGIPTPGGESAAQAADDLLAQVGLARDPSSGADEIGQQHWRCDTESFHSRAYCGNGALDHMKHLYGMHLMMTHNHSIVDFWSDVRHDQGESPRTPELLDSHPESFNASTEIAFHVPVRSEVCLEVFDGLGRKLQTIGRGEFASGDDRARYDALNEPNGTNVLCLSLGAVVSPGGSS
jgi:hypothetical protein